MPYGTQVNRVKRPEIVYGRIGQHLVCAQVAIATKIEFRRFVLKTCLLGCGLQDFESLDYDFGPGSIPGNDCNFVQCVLLF